MSALPSLKQLQDAQLISHEMADVAHPLAELVAAEEASLWTHDEDQHWHSASTSFTYGEPAAPRPYPAALRLGLVASLAVASWIAVLAAGYVMVKVLR
ncbi:MAG: hypothetical protein KGJ57_03770 [Sphingomonadales bacterium]|nr:hypothetical protein [Sphingomonadales bacterium]MDE2168529.1 hypothetical protein [Sphingomonadales bacterium]